MTYVTIQDTDLLSVLCRIPGLRIKHHISGQTVAGSLIEGYTTDRHDSGVCALMNRTNYEVPDYPWWYQCDGKYPIEFCHEDLLHVGAIAIGIRTLGPNMMLAKYASR